MTSLAVRWATGFKHRQGQGLSLRKQIHPASCPTGAGRSPSLGAKFPKHQTDRSCTTSIEVKNAWGIIPIPFTRLHGITLGTRTYFLPKMELGGGGKCEDLNWIELALFNPIAFRFHNSKLDQQLSNTRGKPRTSQIEPTT